MKQSRIALFALFVLIVGGVSLVVRAALAQTQPGKGWVEGVIVNEKGDGVGVWVAGQELGARITIRPAEGNGLFTESDPIKGGFYTFRDLKPGQYEVFLDKTGYEYPNDVEHYKPIHVFGLNVEAGKRTYFKIVVHEGKDMEELGTPVVPTQKAVIISEELERLQRQIDELKKKSQ